MYTFRIPFTSLPPPSLSLSRSNTHTHTHKSLVHSSFPPTRIFFYVRLLCAVSYIRRTTNIYIIDRIFESIQHEESDRGRPSSERQIQGDHWEEHAESETVGWDIVCNVWQWMDLPKFLDEYVPKFLDEWVCAQIPGWKKKYVSFLLVLPS